MGKVNYYKNYAEQAVEDCYESWSEGVGVSPDYISLTRSELLEFIKELPDDEELLEDNLYDEFVETIERLRKEVESYRETQKRV